jgi:Putative Actinobacterial Holin-X, holin superfamily III
MLPRRPAHREQGCRSMDAGPLRNSAIARVLSDLLADFSVLFQKELRLAKAEITHKVTSKLLSSLWIVVAGVIGFMAALVLVQAAVFAIASFGLALHWSCLVVAAVLTACAAAAFFHGGSVGNEGLIPTRTVRQISKDVETAKEQLT